MGELFWFFMGTISGFIINLITPPIYDWIKPKVKRLVFKKRTARLDPGYPGEGFVDHKMKLGDIELDFIILQYARYTPQLIECTYNEKKPSINVDIERLRTDFIDDLKRKQKKGEPGLPYNSNTYKLKSFDVSRRKIIDGEEIPYLRMDFGPTDYFQQLVTDLNTTNPTRQRYAQAANLMNKPVEEFASILGMNFNLITSDGYLIITKRSSGVNINGGIYHTSVAENLLRPTDSDAKGAPDLFHCARRGTQEEIGVELDINQIEFTTFGVYPPWCQYKLIGWSQIKESKEEVLEIYKLAIPKDKWENSHLIFVPCKPDAISHFIKSTDRRSWYDIGLACVILSLFQVGYKYAEISKAFSK